MRQKQTKVKEMTTVFCQVGFKTEEYKIRKNRNHTRMHVSWVGNGSFIVHTKAYMTEVQL